MGKNIAKNQKKKGTIKVGKFNIVLMGDDQGSQGNEQ